MWNQANTLPEKGDNERFTVYLAFDDQSVKLADWCSYTTMGSEYHSNGTYLGEYPQDGDACYMTDDGFDVRKSEDGEWETFCHHEDGTKTRVVVVGWMEAMKPVPQWDKAEVHPLDDHSSTSGRSTMTVAKLVPEQIPQAELRKYLSEQVRLAERNFNAHDDNASRLEEGRSILLASMKLNLVDSGICKSMSAAEEHARSAEQWKNYVRKMHDARREANDARAEWRALERDYWAAVSDEASERQQMRLTR